MGLLQNGRWVDQWYDTESTGGAFERQESSFRERIVEGGKYPPQADRYHLVVSLACPWAHRTLIARELKGLQGLIAVTIVDPLMLENGWEFTSSSDSYALGVECSHLYELYLHADPGYEGRVTVPVLWDRKTQSIVNNESSDILRILNSSFNGITGNTLDLYPSQLTTEIDEINDRVYDNVNNGVYKAGFATQQDVYIEAVKALFDTLDWLEKHLQGREYLCGDEITEADIRLFTTLVRFDAVYHGHFKCNLRLLRCYDNLYRYVKRILALPGVASTVNFEHIKKHYYGSHGSINPTGIVPLGPEPLL